MYQPEPGIIELISQFIESPHDPALRERVDELCAADPDIAAYTESRLLDWLQKGSAVVAVPTAPVAPVAQSATESKQKLVWAAVLTAVIAVGLAIYFMLRTGTQLQVYRNTGKQCVTIPLIKPNSITLNKGATVAYNDKLKGNPAVKMLGGDMYIEVDRPRPLTIQLDEQTVMLTKKGAFNIHKSAGIIQVVTIKGSATVIQDEVKEWPLKPKMQVKRQPHQQIIHSSVKSLSALAWKTGVLNFKDIPLSEVLDGINSYHNVDIIIPPSASRLNKRMITADFTGLSLTEVINHLRKILKLPVVKERPGKFYITLK